MRTKNYLSNSSLLISPIQNSSRLVKFKLFRVSYDKMFINPGTTLYSTVCNNSRNVNASHIVKHFK